MRKVAHFLITATTVRESLSSKHLLPTLTNDLAGPFHQGRIMKSLQIAAPSANVLSLTMQEELVGEHGKSHVP